MRETPQGAAFWNPVLRRHTGEERTFGDRAADALAGFAGSWVFVLGFAAVILIWMTYNGGRGSGRFDPYPYILLNLLLSTLAAMQAPVILMSQNRADAKRNSLAEQDFVVNRRAEAENQVLAEILGVPREEFEARVGRELARRLPRDGIEEA